MKDPRTHPETRRIYHIVPPFVRPAAAAC
jgi:hypothetical protein